MRPCARVTLTEHREGSVNPSRFRQLDARPPLRVCLFFDKKLSRRSEGLQRLLASFAYFSSSLVMNVPNILRLFVPRYFFFVSSFLVPENNNSRLNAPGGCCCISIIQVHLMMG